MGVKVGKRLRAFEFLLSSHSNPGVHVHFVKDEAGRQSPALHGERERQRGGGGRRSSTLLTVVWVSMSTSELHWASLMC